MHFFTPLLLALPGILATHTGKATFYPGTMLGACQFTAYKLPANIFGTCINGPQWSNSANCGRCISVKGPNGNNITAMIVDECRECERNRLDMFQNAFAQLDDLSKGIIGIEWDYIDCGFTTPLQVHIKGGSSRYWFSAQIQNANEGVCDLQVSTDSGKTWQKGLVRQAYNFFNKDGGFGVDTVWVKAISISGKSVVIENVTVAGDVVTDGPSNF